MSTQEDDAAAADRRKWMQQGVATRPVREPSEVTCVTELPQAVGPAYVPPAGFDCEPVREKGQERGWGARARAADRGCVGCLFACTPALRVLTDSWLPTSPLQEEKAFSGPESASEDVEEEVLESERRKRPRKR
jgi:hypothetical protein